MRISPTPDGTPEHYWELAVPMVRANGDPVKITVRHPSMHTVAIWAGSANLAQNVADRYQLEAIGVIHAVVAGLALLLGRWLSRARSERTSRVVGATVGFISLATTFIAGGKLGSTEALIAAAMFLFNVVALLCSLRRSTDDTGDANVEDTDVEDDPVMNDEEAQL